MSGGALRARVPTRRVLCALTAFLATLAFHAWQIPPQGLTDDDDFYAPAGIRYADWLGDVFTQPSTALSRAGVDAAFKMNHEHPPLAKMVFGVAHAATPFAASLDAARMGTALFAALLAAFLVLLTWEPLGPCAAITAPLLLLSLPRFVFHSEVATLDVPVACAVVVVTAAYFWADTGRRWPLLAGVAFGLSLLIKLNAPFAVLPCALWTLLSQWRGFRVQAAALALPPAPRALLWMVILGPVLFVVLWPWLWFDTIDRVAAYIAFHLNHYPIYLFYDGEIWERPFAPWHAVIFLGLGALPAPVAMLGALGSLRAARAIVRRVRGTEAAGDKLRALLFLQAAFSMAVVANPATPRYGGEKLFMPFFPLFCALAADGVVMVVAALRAFVPRVSARTAAIVVTVLACAPGVAGTVRHRGGYALSYYGELVGGLRGATARGYERTYYDVADKPLARWLDANAKGSRIHFEPNHKEYARTYRWLKRDAVISSEVNLVDDMASAEVVVLTHERRWSTYPALKATLDDTARWTPIFEKSIDGVPLYTVFRRR